MSRHGGLTRDVFITNSFNAGRTYLEIAESLGTSRNAIAGVCRRLNLRRDPTRLRKPRAPKAPRIVISPEEQAERKQDERDLEMLDLIHEGYSIMSVARSRGVSYRYLQALAKEARAA